MKNEYEIIQEMQQVVEQMRLDDIYENPESCDEEFVCDYCGERKELAGSIDYDGYRLCNDCVLIVETGLALGKICGISKIKELIEERQLEQMVKYIRDEEKRAGN